jgi:Tfp pilus assembly protein PilW
MAVGLVVLGAVLNIFIHQNRTSAAQQEVAYAQQNVRAAMDLMLREIRNAGYNPAGVGGFSAILAADATYIRIQSDLNEDGDTDDAPDSDPAAPDLEDPNEDVVYEYDSANRKLGRGARYDPADTTAPEPTAIVQDVSSFEFHYVLVDGTMLDPPGAALTADQMSDVRAVIIRIGVRTENPAPDTGEHRVRTLENGARIRNLGFQDVE